MAFAYPRLDSAVWTSSATLPPIARALAFDQNGGVLAFVDTAGRPGRLDLRLGDVSTLSQPSLTGLASADGAFIYGITETADVARLAPSGESWSFDPPGEARQLLPQADGWLVVVGSDAEGSVLWRLHPPEEAIVDTLRLPPVQRAVTAGLGDRLYFAVSTGLVGARARGLETVPEIRFDDSVRALTSTPSGDRIFIATAEGSELLVMNRYTEDIDRRIELPGAPAGLRMDPLGRYLLVQSAAGSSAWVIALATDSLLGAVTTRWRSDLPHVTADGMLMLVQGDDVAVVDAESLEPRRTVPGGARDWWHFFTWDGFRPAAPETNFGAPADTAVAISPADTAQDTLVTTVPPQADSLARADSSPVARSDTVPATPRREPPAAPPVVTGFTVSFATLLSEPSAEGLAASINVGGQRPRVVVNERSGTPVYRVVLGPYATRADADRIGRASGESYWIIEGAP